MSRRPWGPVLVTAAALVLASQAPRLAGHGLAPAGRLALGATTTTATRLARQAAPAAASAWVAIADARETAGRGLAAAGQALERELAVPAHAAFAARAAEALALALLAGLIALVTAGPRRRSRGAVLRLARAGRPAERIARRTGLARDAVRMALRPELATRRHPADAAANGRRLPFARGARRPAAGLGSLR